MSTLFLDLETYCDVPIKNGTHAYAEQAQVLLVAYAFDDEDVTVLDTSDDWASARGKVQMLIDSADRVVIHNSAFDRTVLRHRGVHIPLDKVEDTMVIALAHSLPASLGELCDVLGVEADKAKDKAGKKLIQLFSKPRPKTSKLRRANRDSHPEEWQAFIEYARLDVDAMRALWRKLPRWNSVGSERDLWILDQRINDRGVAVDLELARSAVRAAERSARSLGDTISRLTGGAVPSATQRQRLMDYLLETHDFDPGDLTGPMVDKWLASDLDPAVRELLTIRRQAAATSPAKYDVLLRGTSSDGRLRGTLQFAGASRTGRWGGRLFQPQNLPRPSLAQEHIDAGIDAMKLDVEDLVFDNVMELCSSAVRGCLVAPAGRKLVVADLSNIEGRMLAWLADEDWKVRAFREFDNGIGADLYKLAYARAYGMDVSRVTKDDRQIGKVMELALGYQGGPGAFNSMAANLGVVLPEEKVIEIVKAWRKAHGNVVSLWYDTERAARSAINNPGNVYRSGRLSLRCDGAWLRIRLPSGRYLCYPHPEVDPDTGKLSYMGVNQYSRKWERLDTYGGKLIENVTQAASRDVLAHGMMLAETNGYEVVLHVHDELLTETPDNSDYTAEGLGRIMSANPAWAKGLPLAAAGFETPRYRKD